MPERMLTARGARARAEYARHPVPRRIEISEWLLSAAMAVVGAHLMIFPSAIYSSSMHMLTDFFPWWMIGGTCLILGIVRLTCLFSGGTSLHILRMRSVLSFLSSIVWFEMAFAFMSRFAGSVPPPGFEMIVIIQVLGDLWLTFRILRLANEMQAKGAVK